ncbi:MAG: galactitol system component [Thermosediminibacterales bacterium]|nr:galactitol system component [Thermosediminibacterales bacterium]MDK2835764.1 galactitol system component [Thermosediminibacterales bacterium]
MLVGYDFKGTLILGMSMVGVMLLMPRMVKILIERLIAVFEVVRDFMQKRFAGQEFYILVSIQQ